MKKKMNDGFLSYLQNSTANSVHLIADFCPALVCPQKATVRIQFLPYFWNPLIKWTLKMFPNPKTLFWCFNTLETHIEMYTTFESNELYLLKHVIIATGVKPEDCEQKQAKSRCRCLLLLISRMLG